MLPSEGLPNPESIHSFKAERLSVGGSTGPKYLLAPEKLILFTDHPKGVIDWKNNWIDLARIGKKRINPGRILRVFGGHIAHQIVTTKFTDENPFDKINTIPIVPTHIAISTNQDTQNSDVITGTFKNPIDFTEQGLNAAIHQLMQDYHIEQTGEPPTGIKTILDSNSFILQSYIADFDQLHLYDEVDKLSKTQRLAIYYQIINFYKQLADNGYRWVDSGKNDNFLLSFENDQPILMLNDLIIKPIANGYVPKLIPRDISRLITTEKTRSQLFLIYQGVLQATGMSRVDFELHSKLSSLIFEKQSEVEVLSTLLTAIQENVR